MSSTFAAFISNHDWLIIMGLLLSGMIIFHGLSRRVYRFLLSHLTSQNNLWLVSLIEATYTPWLTFFWLYIISFIVPIVMLRFHIDLSRLPVVNVIRSFLFLGACYWSLLNFITKMEQEIAPRASRLPVRDKTTVRALAQLSRVILTLLVILMILPMLGFHTSSLLVFGGASGIAAGFAAKDTLANVLGGMMIFWDRPFSVGDWISSPDRNVEGTVEHIGWRLTRIRTFSKQPLYVPNGLFSSIILVNPSRMTHRQINVTIGVRYDDAAQIEKIVKAIDHLVRHHPAIDTTQSILVHFIEFATSSLNINIWAFIKTTDWAKYRDAQQDIFLKSIEIITAHGAECAFPTTTLHVPDPVMVAASKGDARNDFEKNQKP